MSTTETRGLFGPDRIQPGPADTEWSVWISGMDDILNQPDRETALMVAAETNATACDIYDGNPFTPVVYAVVLYRGHAWKRGDDTIPTRRDGVRVCTTCRSATGPFVPHTPYCEDCAPTGGGQ